MNRPDIDFKWKLKKHWACLILKGGDMEAVFVCFTVLVIRTLSDESYSCQLNYDMIVKLGCCWYN